MAVIRKDDRGLYANVGGYIVRPLLDTQYKEGDHVDGHHYGGTTTVGMGKNKDTPSVSMKSIGEPIGRGNTT